MNYKKKKQNTSPKSFSYHKINSSKSNDPNDLLFVIDISHLKKEIIHKKAYQNEIQNKNKPSTRASNLLKQRPQTPTLKPRTLTIDNLNVSPKQPSINRVLSQSSYKDKYIKASNNQLNNTNNNNNKHIPIKRTFSVPKKTSNANLLSNENNNEKPLIKGNKYCIDKVQNRNENIINNYFIERKKHLENKQNNLNDSNKFRNNNYHFLRPYCTIENKTKTNNKTPLYMLNNKNINNNQLPTKLIAKTTSNKNNTMVKFTYDMLNVDDKDKKVHVEIDNKQNNLGISFNSNLTEDNNLIYPNKISQELIQKKNAMLNEILSKAGIEIDI